MDRGPDLIITTIFLPTNGLKAKVKNKVSSDWKSGGINKRVIADQNRVIMLKQNSNALQKKTRYNYCYC